MRLVMGEEVSEHLVDGRRRKLHAVQREPALDEQTGAAAEQARASAVAMGARFTLPRTTLSVPRRSGALSTSVPSRSKAKVGRFMASAVPAPGRKVHAPYLCPRGPRRRRARGRRVAGGD